MGNKTAQEGGLGIEERQFPEFRSVSCLFWFCLLCTFVSMLYITVKIIWKTRQHVVKE